VAAQRYALARTKALVLVLGGRRASRTEYGALAFDRGF
jgi:hypothetical protein